MRRNRCVARRTTSSSTTPAASGSPTTASRGPQQRPHRHLLREGRRHPRSPRSIFPLDAPNGIGLSPDGDRLYVAETHTGRAGRGTCRRPAVEGAEPVGPAAATCSSALARLPAVRLARGRRRRLGLRRHARERRHHVVSPDGSTIEHLAHRRPAHHQHLLRRPRPAHRVHHVLGHGPAARHRVAAARACISPITCERLDPAYLWPGHDSRAVTFENPTGERGSRRSRRIGPQGRARTA